MDKATENERNALEVATRDCGLKKVTKNELHRLKSHRTETVDRNRKNVVHFLRDLKSPHAGFEEETISLFLFNVCFLC
jgi:hypothetical protein